MDLTFAGTDGAEESSTQMTFNLYGKEVNYNMYLLIGTSSP